MKKVTIFLITVFCCQVCLAQLSSHLEKSRGMDVTKKIKIDNCRYTITYKFKFLEDTVVKSPYYDMQILEIGDSVVCYRSIFAERVDSAWYRYIMESKNRLPNADQSDGINPEREAGLEINEDPQFENIYTNYPKKGIQTVITLLYTPYVYSEAIPDIRWHTESGTDLVLGFQCYKAVTTFRGRKYTAWFTPLLPFGFGPWKFRGLPGIILKISDTKGYFEWTAVGIGKKDESTIYAYKLNDKDTKRVSRKELTGLLHKRWADPFGLSQAYAPGQYVFYNEITGELKSSKGEHVDFKLPYIPVQELDLINYEK